MQRNAKYGLVTAPLLAGVERLWANRERLINGKTITPAWWLDFSGLDDTAKTWTCRATGAVLSEAGSGSSPDLGAQGPYLNERAAQAAASGKYLQTAASGVFDIGTEDLLVAGALKPQGSLGFLLDKQAGETGGWALFDTGSAIAFRLKTASATTDVATSGGYTQSWLLFVACVNRDEASTNGALAYQNNVAGSGIDMSARSGSLSNSANAVALDRLTTGMMFNNPVGLIAVYKQADLWASGATGATQMAAAAKELTSLYFGTEALHGHAALTPDSF